MNIPDSTLDQLSQTLSNYNPVTNEAMEKIATSLQPVGIAILTILFFLELNTYVKKFDSDDGGMTTNIYLTIAMKYLVAYFLIMFSSSIVDGIVWIGIQVGKWINSIVEITGKTDAIPPLAKMKLWQRPIAFLFRLFAYISLIIAGWVANILIFMRGIELYIIKAVAPIIVAFFVHDELRSISVGFFKFVMGVVLQGALIILILGLIPIVTANDFSNFGSLDGDLLENAGTVVTNIFDYLGLIIKYVIIILLLIGSQRKAKQFMGAM